MLQIATGKLFTRPAGRENLLRGMLYTNAILARENTVDTVAGRLLPSSSYSIRPAVLVSEFTERMEGEELKPGVIASSGVEPYLQDYSVVVSFSLNCVCTPDVDLARRLTTGQRGLVTRVTPQTLVRRFFDGDIWCKPDELKFLEDFVEKLIGLPRRTFLGVMRAIRTYVNGMHRIADDLELAYTLLVASVESLAQDFDDHKSDWESFDERKRKEVDEALSGADEVIAQRVREALLRVEHVALARRFREFAVAHTPSTYFRQASDTANEPLLGRSDLAEVLGTAYQSRSKYVHQLRQLPHSVTLGHSQGETAINGRTTHLTLQGLSRLMRSVIIEFVMRQPTILHEPYDYHLERSGVVQMRMAPQYWIGRAEGDITKAGRDKLEGFLQQIASCLLRKPDAVVTDLKPVLAVACKVVPRLEKRLRLPYLALHALFNMNVVKQDSADMPPAIEALIQEELGEPSSEALIAHALAGQTVTWSLEDHRVVLNTYFRRRAAANGLRLPRLFEAAITLELAERLRCAGDMEGCREVVALAVENHPGHTELLESETNLLPEVPINWREVMLPPAEQPQ
ncbi:MAG: hypothetical protein KA735_02770 [Burkholderiaceae bacterium]|nr:hypothetical protein [Burkholderiaceae bacterium]